MPRTFCLVLLLLAAVAALAQSDAALNETRWTVKYVAGPVWLGSDKVTFFTGPDGFVVDARYGHLKIPMSDVASVIYSPTRFSRGESFSASGLAGRSATSEGTAMYDTAYFLVAAIASGMHGQKHFVTIAWEQEGVEQELMIEVDKQNALPLMTEIEKAAGTKWMNIDQRAQKVAAELDRNKANAFALTLDRDVRAGRFRLGTGAYQAILLEHDANAGELYLFKTTPELANLKAIVPVQLEKTTGSSSSPVVVYRQKEPAGIEGIRLPDKNLKVQ
jgi:hypothetical protein